MVSPKEDRTRHELYTHLGRIGIEGDVIDPPSLDLDHDYPYLDLDTPSSGATSLGSIRIHGYTVNLVNITREKNFEVGHLGFGGDYGPIEFVTNGWRLRFFITFYDEWEVPLPEELTEFHLLTKVELEKSFMRSKVVDFNWEPVNGDKPNTRIEEAIRKTLNDDAELKKTIMAQLPKERNITVKSYKPKKTPEQTRSEPSHARIVLFGEARKRKDIFVDRTCFDMYNRIAENIVQVKTAL